MAPDMTVIFLDFDGVLHPEPATDEQAFCRRRHLWQILEACPLAEVVFSTSWREFHPMPELIQLATEGGGERFAGCFIGATPHAVREPGAYIARQVYRRERECRLWLAGNGQMQRPWLALDDFSAYFSPASPNLHLVDHKTGLTEADVIAIISRLGA